MSVAQSLNNLFANGSRLRRGLSPRNRKSRDRFVPKLSVTTLESRVLLSASIAGTGDAETLWMVDSPEPLASDFQNHDAALVDQVEAVWTDPDAFNNEFMAWYQAQDLSTTNGPISVRLTPASGTHTGLAVDIPDGVVLIIDGSAGDVRFTGASPAFTVSGTLILQNLNIETATNDPTILVQSGGSLTLINSVVNESASHNQSAIFVQAGGTIDLSSGDNLINVQGDGHLITWQTASDVNISGNRLAVDGSEFDTGTRVDNFAIEDRITHGLDQATFGLVRWANQQIFVTQDSGSVARAVAKANNGDTIHVAAGTFVHTGQLDINRSITIIGAGQDQTVITRSGQATATELRTVQINAADVRMESLTLNGWTVGQTNATIGNGYLVWLNTSAHRTTFNDVRFHGDDIRVAIYLGTQNDFTITNSIFTGTYFRAAIRGAGERMLISHNRFEESHYWYSPIYMEYGAPTSGEISFNYFVSRVGVNNTSQGLFKSDGTGLHAITNLQPNRTTADGLHIFHNTFHFQDADLVNQLGNRPVPEAIHIAPLLPASGPIVIRDNIFQGYTYTGPQPTGDPLWQPSGGIIGGALEFDGVDDFGWFIDPNLEIGNSGSLSLWVKLDELGRQQTLVHGALEVQIDGSNRIYFYANKTNPGSVNNTLVRSAALSPSVIGQWTHIAVTWDLPTKTGRIYINGSEAAYSSFGPSLPNWSVPNPTANRIFYIGSDPSNATRWLNGTLDDVAFFNTALTAGQVSSIHSGGSGGDSVNTVGPTSNLVLHWALDQSVDRVAVSSVRGIELNLVPNGVPLGATETALYRDGEGIDFGNGPTGALQFDGLSNYATFTDPNLNIGTNGSMTMWVKLDAFGRQQTLMHGALEVQIDSSRRIYFYANKANSGNVNDTLVRSAALPSNLAGTWVHIAITWDLGNKTGRIFVNGAEIGYSSFGPSRPLWNVPNPTAGEMFFLGNDPRSDQWGGSARFFGGLMDDVALFGTTLTQAQIAAIRSTGVSPTFNPVAHWNFDSDQVDGIYFGASGTTIPLELFREPPPAPLFGYAINASANTVVSNNVFFENDIDYNAIVNDLGDNLFGDPVFNLLRAAPDPSQPDYQVGFGGMATYASSSFLTNSFTSIPHVGAYQGNPGLFGSGDLIVRGSSADDLLVISNIVRDNVTGLYSATARYVRDVGGPNEIVLDPILLVDVSGILFNGALGDDHFIVIHPNGDVLAPTNGITFNGGTGGENSPGGNSAGDLLELRGGAVDHVSYNVTSALDGTIAYNGAPVITYTGVEPMIDTIATNDRDFVWQSLTGPIRLINEPTSGLQRIEYDNGQQLLFRLPIESLKVTHLGSPTHDIEVQSLDTIFLGRLTIENTGDVKLLAPLTLTAGGLTIDGNNVFLQQAITTSQAILITADNALQINANVHAGPATITLLVNQDGLGIQGLTQTPLTVLSTSNTTADAVLVRVGGSGNFLVSQIQTGTSDPLAQATLDVGGAVINVQPSGTMNITTSRLVVDAGLGIGGPSQALRTEIQGFAATSDEGYIWIIEKDDVQLQGVSATGLIPSGPPQINVQSLAGAISVLSGTWIRSSTGQVNNIPPQLRLTQADPADVLLPGDPTQEVVGTIGGIESLGDQLELGNHFRIEARWDDGIVSVLDFPTAANVTPSVTGLPSQPILQAGDSVIWLIDQRNLSTASIVRGPVAEGPIQIFIERTYPLLYLQGLRQPEVAARFDLFNDPNIVLVGATQPSLNRSSPVVIITPVADEMLRPSVPVVLVTQPIIFPESKETVVVDIPPPPPGQIVIYDDSTSLESEEEDTATRLYLVRILPNGQEGEQVKLSLGELRDLSGLLERLKTAPIPNGMYRIYYQEAGLPAQQLLEFRKAGGTIGDPVREPGRGSNRLQGDDETSDSNDATQPIDDSASLSPDIDQGQHEAVAFLSRFSVNSSTAEATSFHRIARQIRRWSS